MSPEQVRYLALSFPFVTEGFPFDENTLVFKVGGKMFLLIDLLTTDHLTIKANPDEVFTLTDEHSWILPGYHMNKSHWITIKLMDDNTKPQLIQKLIETSYSLVYKKLSKKVKNGLESR